MCRKRENHAHSPTACVSNYAKIAYICERGCRVVFMSHKRTTKPPLMARRKNNKNFIKVDIEQTIYLGLFIRYTLCAHISLPRPHFDIVCIPVFLKLLCRSVPIGVFWPMSLFWGIIVFLGLPCCLRGAGTGCSKALLLLSIRRKSRAGFPDQKHPHLTSRRTHPSLDN